MSEQAILLQAGIELTRLVVSQTAGTVNKKIAASRATKDANKLREMYEEIISELLEERAEAIRIAQTYKERIDRIEISDADITHLHETIKNLLEVIGQSMSQQAKDSIDPLLKLIDVNTLKTMQLLGFNYKQAIGEPLTTVCAETITRKLKPQAASGGKQTAPSRNNRK